MGDYLLLSLPSNQKTFLPELPTFGRGTLDLWTMSVRSRRAQVKKSVSSVFPASRTGSGTDVCSTWKRGLSI